MSLLSDLKPNRGSVKSRQRVGRGDSSGWGGTAGKGHKGQKARAGGGIRRGFEGGQMPLMRRLPKFGFKNTPFKNRYDVVTTERLNKFDGEVTPETLKAAGVVSGNEKVKVVVRGELSKAINLKVHKVSGGAKKAIEDKGGSVEEIGS